MNLGDSVLVERKDSLPFEGVVMVFAGQKVRVDWTENENPFNPIPFFSFPVKHSQYFDRPCISVCSFEDNSEDTPDCVHHLWDECLKIGWVRLNQGRWNHADHKEYPCQGEVGIGRAIQAEIKAKDIRHFLKQALTKLRENS